MLGLVGCTVVNHGIEGGFSITISTFFPVKVVGTYNFDRKIEVEIDETSYIGRNFT